MDGSTTHHDRPPTLIPIPHFSRRCSLLAASPNVSVPPSDIRSPDTNPPAQNLSKLLARSKDELLSLISSSEIYAHRIREVWDLVSSHEHTSSSSAAQIQKWKQSVFAAVSEEAITEQLQKAAVTEQRKLAYQKRVIAAWGILPGLLLPKYTPPDGGWSRDAWQGLAELAELVKDPAEGQRRLEQQVKTRLSTGGKRSPGWRGHSWLGHQDILQVFCEEQHLQQEPRYAEEHGDSENFNVRKRRKNKKDNSSAVTHMSAKRKSKINSGKTSAATAGNIDIDPYGEEGIKGSRHNSADEEKPAKEIPNDADLKKAVDEHSNADYDNSETKNQIEKLHEGEECQLEQENTMLSIGPESNEPSKEYKAVGRSNILINSEATAREAQTTRQSKTKTLKRQRSPSVSRNLIPNVKIAPSDHDETASAPLNSLPSSTGTLVTADLPWSPPCADASAFHGTVTSTYSAALASLHSGQRLTTTALEQILKLFKTPSYYILDPSFLDKSWEPRSVKVRPQVKALLIPLYHSDAGHWTIACCNIQDRTIDHYNSLPSSKASPTLLSMLEKFATEYAGPSPDAWEYRAPMFSRQANLVDCGVFAGLAAMYLMADLLPPTNLSNCDVWRFVFRAILQNGVPSTDELASLFEVHKPAVVTALECLDVVDLSAFTRHIINGRFEDAKSIDCLQAIIDSLSTIYIAWLAVKTQTEVAMTIARFQLGTAHSDQVRYNAVFTTIAQLTSAQKPNTDSLREWAIKNLRALQAAKVESTRLEERYRIYDVGLNAISVVERVVRESKREMEKYIREVGEKVEPLIKKYNELKREMQEIRRGLLEDDSTPENQEVVPLV